MLTKLSITAAAFVLMSASALAGECKIDGEAPAMPDPASATYEDRQATMEAIIAFQDALTEYRNCLDEIIADTDLDTEKRQDALNAFNASVDTEKEMVAKWQAFDEAYRKANG